MTLVHSLVAKPHVWYHDFEVLTFTATLYAVNRIFLRLGSAIHYNQGAGPDQHCKRCNSHCRRISQLNFISSVR